MTIRLHGLLRRRSTLGEQGRSTAPIGRGWEPTPQGTLRPHQLWLRVCHWSILGQALGQWCLSFTVTPALHPTGGPCRLMSGSSEGQRLFPAPSAPAGSCALVNRTQSPSLGEGTHQGTPDSHASSPLPAQSRCSGSICRECPSWHSMGRETDASPMASKSPSAWAPNGLEKWQPRTVS